MVIVLGLTAVLVVAALLALAGKANRTAQRLSAVENELNTVQAQARSALLGEERLARALAAIPQGVVIADDAGEVVFRNHAATSFFAARHSDALVEAAIHELVAEAVIGRSSARSLELYGPPRRTLELSSVPLADGGLVVVDDSTERRRLEAVRRDFVANISHELKTPIGAIGLLAETLANEDDPEVAQRLAARVLQEALRISRIVEDLLELSRIEAAEAPSPSHEPVPVHLAMAEAVDRTRPAAELSGIDLHVDHPSSRVTVIGDRRQLVSALSNLLDNAVKYSDPGSDVWVRASTDGRFVEVDIEDQGIGIPSTDLERVFERFYRVDRARSRETGGTGLGLAIVRHVVSNHDGEVRVRSREGEGSVFTLRLPAGPGPVAVADRADDDHDEQEAG